MRAAAAGRGPVTLKDVAEHAQVSISTASNALTGARKVSAASIEKVLRSAAELGYQRNEAARSLRTGLHNSIGLVIPDVTNPFWAGMVGAVEQIAGEAGFQVALFTTAYDPERESAALARLVTSADGVLLFSTSPDASAVQPLLDLGMPMVACDEAFDVPGLGGVYSDNRAGARTAAEHLVDAGGAVFGMLDGPATLTTATERRQGFREGLAARGVPESRIHAITAPYSFEGGREGVRRLLEAHPDVDALFACTDNQAIGATFEAHDLGRSVPGDLLVCGFDDISWSSRISPSLTTVRQDAPGMAARAIEMLLAMVAGEEQAEVVVLPVELVERESTAREPSDRVTPPLVTAV